MEVYESKDFARRKPLNSEKPSKIIKKAYKKSTQKSKNGFILVERRNRDPKKIVSRSEDSTPELTRNLQRAVLVKV